MVFNKNNNNWPLPYVSWTISNLQMATIYLVFLKDKNIYVESKNKTICKVARHVQSKIQTYCLNKRFKLLYYFTI